MGRITDWARSKSPWSIHYCIACCSLEIGNLMNPFYDAERFGFLPMPSPRQADLILIAGLLNRKMLMRFARVYFQVPEPKRVIAVGTCPMSGGVYWGSYSVLPNVPDIVPINYYVEGCPPRTDVVIDAIRAVRDRWREIEISEEEKKEKEKKLLEYAKIEPVKIEITEGEVKDAPLPEINVEGELGELAKDIKDLLGDAVAGIVENRDVLDVYIPATRIKESIKKMIDKYGESMILSYITARDLPKEKAFEILYSFWNIEKQESIHIKTRIPRDNPYIDSIKDVLPAADFYERETWEMFGIVFNGHGDLRYLLLPEDWKDAPPLRKDYKVRW